MNSIRIGFFFSRDRRKFILQTEPTNRLRLYAACLAGALVSGHLALDKLLGAGSSSAVAMIGAVMFAAPPLWFLRTAARRVRSPREPVPESASEETETQDVTSHEVGAPASALVTSSRLATIGQLSTAMVHELNNPLTYARANLRQLREDWDAVQKAAAQEARSDETQELAAEIEELIDESLEGVERVIAMVRDVTGFAHPGFDHAEEVELKSLLAGVVRVASPQLKPGAKIQCNCPEPVWISGRPQELKQVFLNIVVNAIQAVNSQGTIQVSAWESEGRAVVCIEDDGPGISSKNVEKIFDSFYTTKPVGQGTGLGLSISREIVERHQGEIGVDSEPNRGTRVTVSLSSRI